MLSLLNYSIQKYIRDFFPGLSGLVVEILASLISLLVYWYTAKAFSSAWNQNFLGGGSYFEYVFIGELALALPQSLFFQIARAARGSLADGTLEHIVLVPRRFPWAILSLGLGSLPYELLKIVLTLLLAHFFFGFSWGVSEASRFFFLQTLALPIFAGMGLAAAGLFLLFGRGLGVLVQISALAQVAAGVYFPIALFPETLAQASRLLSPFTFLLETTREALGQGGSVDWLQAAGLAILWSILSLGAAYLLIKISLLKARERGGFPIPAP